MNVRLMIDGLSGYLEEPFGSPSSVHILFPDLRKSVTRHSNIGDIVVCEHSPKLVLPDGTEWALDGEHIVIEGGAGLIALDSSYTDRMSDMKEIALGSEIVDSSYLGDPPKSPGTDHVDLVADLVVEHGTFNVADKDLTPLLAFRVAPDAAPVLEGRFAALVQIEIPVPGNVLTVSTVRFIDEKVTNRQVFLGGDTDFLDLLIKNRCERPSDPTRPDNDFVIYYDLSFNYNGPKPIPYPVDGGQSTAREVDASAGGPGGCIAGRYHSRS